jgi:hypothetical protein
VLPSTLNKLFAVNSSTSDSTATPSIRTRISTRIAANAREQLQEVYLQKLNKIRADTFNNAFNTRATANNKFFKALNNHKADLIIIKEEGITELRNRLDSTVNKLIKRADAIRDKTDVEMQEHAKEFCLKACKRFGNAVATEEARYIQRIRKIALIAGQDARNRQVQQATLLLF